MGIVIHAEERFQKAKQDPIIDPKTTETYKKMMAAYIKTRNAYDSRPTDKQ